MSSVIDLTALGLRDEYGPIGYFAELFRQRRTDDEEFYKTHTYYFVLKVPPSALAVPGSPSEFVFPLIIPPSSISITEPFAVNQVQTMYGGLYVEEGGLNGRTIVIEGTTGFAPRKLQGNTHVQLLNPDLKRHYRELQDVVKIERLSGQKHFQFLQDRVFRAYGDLKRSPIEAKDTILSFHLPHMKENFQVTPLSFELEQDTEKFPLYHYKIELLAVPYTYIDPGLEDDTNYLKAFRGGLNFVRKCLGEVRGALTALAEISNTIAMSIQGLGQVIGDCSQIVRSAEDFANGVTRIIKAPATFVSRTADLIEDTNSFVQTVNSIPDDVKAAYENACLELQQALDGFGTRPDLFEQSLSTRRDSQSRSALSGVSASEQSALSIVETSAAEFPSIRSHTLTQGETLESLASRELGDTSLWPLIAEVNDLRAPYFVPLGGERLPHTITIGDTIFIPSRDPARGPLAETPNALGVSPAEGPRATLFGCDLLLEPSGQRGEFDLAIDFEHDATDLRSVEDIDNVEQALRTRMRTRRGEHPNFPSLGVPRLVGTKNQVVDFDMTRMQIEQGIVSDPRVSRVTNLRVEQEGDILNVRCEANLRGVGGESTITFPLGDE